MLFLEISVIVLMTAVNGVLAMAELAIVSSRKSRLEQLAAQGRGGARAALRLMADPSRFLSTIQIGITLVGIVAGAYSGATLGQRLGGWLDTFVAISPHGKAVGIGVTVVGITYLSLILGELVPKRIALVNPERVASLVARPMLALSQAGAPAVWLLHVSTESVLRGLGLSGSRETTVTEDEVKSLIAEGTQAGVFAPQEKEMIEGVLRLADRPVRVIMTPRARIAWIDINADRSTLIEMAKSSRYSRLLVCEQTVDNPLGVLQAKDILPEALHCGEMTLADLMTPVLFVPDRTPVLKLLSRFKNEKVHMAVLVDEHGATEGLATPTDVLEAIAGDLPEQGEEEEPKIIRRDDGSWLVDGTLPTDEVEAVIGVTMREEVETLAGFMLHHLGRIPESGASFRQGDARFEIVDMDGNRIDKVLIETAPSAAKSSPSQEPEGGAKR